MNCDPGYTQVLALGLVFGWLLALALWATTRDQRKQIASLQQRVRDAEAHA